MTRAQRRFHLYAWIVLTPAALLLLAVAVLARHSEAPAPPQTAPSAIRGDK